MLSSISIYLLRVCYVICTNESTWDSNYGKDETISPMGKYTMQ